jgi:hypothetical protein
MGFIAQLLNLLSTFEAVAAPSIGVIQSIAASPQAADFEAAFADLFHTTTTPGAALVIEPKATATGSKPATVGK